MNNKNLNNYLIISDLEGYNIEKFISCKCNKLKCDCKNNQSCYNNIYICGDLIDSSWTLTDNSLLTEKNYNLRNIFTILNNTNISLILGNRDINKIKCKYLIKMNIFENNEQINKYIHLFNNGEIDLNYANYKEFITLLNIQNKSDLWTESMDNWKPFWSTNSRGRQKWNTNYNTYPFLRRFYDIFGTDNSPNTIKIDNIDFSIGGTSSASNLLYTIPNELFLDKNIGSIHDVDINDYKAFIVLAIFKSMTINNYDNTDNNNNIINYIKLNAYQKMNNYNINSSFCRGWLCELYRISSFCLVKQFKNNNKNVYLFSHGGITNKLANLNIESYKTIIENVVNKNTNQTLDHSTNESTNQILDQLTNQPIDLLTLTNNIININKYLSNIIKQIIEESNDNYNSIKLQMLTLLIIGSEYNDNSTFKSIDYSPIVCGFTNLINNPFFINNYNLYQFFGHKPNGFAIGIKKLILEKNETNLINLDSSNSFTGTILNAGNSKSYILIKINNNTDDEIILYSIINIKIFPNLITQFSIINDDYIKNITSNNDSKIIVSDSIYNNVNNFINIIINQTINNIYDKNFINFFTIDKILFNGIGNVYFNNKIDNNNNNNNNNYYIFSINGNSFNKSLFILSKNEIDTLYNKMYTQLLGGGSNKIINYKNKYLKYKQKYINYKLYLLNI
jgi:hypothetical protein